MNLPEVKRRLRLADRQTKRRNGELPRSSRYPHAVAIGVDMVTAASYTEFASSYSGPWFAEYGSAVNGALEATVGDNECWFDEGGNAFIGFADKTDAMMFRLALDADPS